MYYYPLLFFVLLFWLSFCFAKLEIQVEGKFGWAKKLPTWRLETDHWISRLFFNGKPATGYHIWLVVFVLSMFHFEYIFIPITLAHEFLTLSFFFYFCVIEDFFWFVFNPAFGLKNFKAKKIWWHKKNWFYIIPGDYVSFSIVATALYISSFYVS